MLVKTIDIADIEVKDRLRPVTPDAVKGLAEDIAKRGLRQPIEVTAQSRGKTYRLVAGAHRLAACKLAGLETIEAFVVSGTIPELRRAEILENISRNDLNALERAQFLAELKRLFQEEHPEARNGGDRVSAEYQSANVGKLVDWYAEVAARSERAIRTIEREASIGLRLTRQAADILRGSDIEDSQKELEALARLDDTLQVNIAKRLASAAEDRPKTVAQAKKAIEGGEDVELDATEKQYKKLMAAWLGAQKDVQAQFIATLRDTGVLEA